MTLCCLIFFLSSVFNLSFLFFLSFPSSSFSSLPSPYPTPSAFIIGNMQEQLCSASAILEERDTAEVALSVKAFVERAGSAPRLSIVWTAFYCCYTVIREAPVAHTEVFKSWSAHTRNHLQKLFIFLFLFVFCSINNNAVQNNFGEPFSFTRKGISILFTAVLWFLSSIFHVNHILSSVWSSFNHLCLFFTCLRLVLCFGICLR